MRSGLIQTRPDTLGQVSTEENPQEPARWDDLPGKEYAELPYVSITLNQLVAYNMAYYRKAAGLTQEELGKLLEGWTQKPWGKAAVSAAERAWDGKRPRQFDADLLLGLSQAIGVPIPAFYLPPEDDGVNHRYLIRTPHPTGGYATLTSMHDLLSHVLSDPPDDDTEANQRYRSRFVATFETHYPGLLPSDYFNDLTTEEELKARVARLRKQYDALRGLMGDLENTFGALDDRLCEIREARPPRDVERGEDG